MRKMSFVPVCFCVTPKSPKGGFNSQCRLGVVLLLLIVSSFNTSAQEIVINNTTLLIAEGKYNDAEKYLDSIMRTEPQNVTALMMKGNVLLNYALMQTPAVQNITMDDESIFSRDVAALKNRTVIIPLATAQKVEKLWKQCLLIDSTRLDIRMGLCSLYGMAVMHNELLSYLPVMKSASKEKGNDFAFTLAEYARLLHERGDKEGAYLAYQKISGLYPTVSSLYCVMSAIYFADNDLLHAREYAEKGLGVAHPDLTACHDALDVYTAIGDPCKVLSVLKVTDRDTNFSEYPFYQGLYKYTHRDTTWIKDIGVFLNQFPVAADSYPVFNAALYMVTDEFTEDYNGMMTLMSNGLNDYSTKLICERLIHDYPDSTVPYIIEAQVLINDKQYAMANGLLKTFTQKHPSQTDVLYYYGYSLYNAGDYKTAIDKWTAYLPVAKKSQQDVAKQDMALAVPYYFLGQSYLKSGNKAKALEYFKLIVAGRDESKYAYLAKVMLDKVRP
jgi:tetratricopeptide (TPR) repeat protein